jgi:hypothetical protein
MNDALARFVILYLQLDKHQLHRLPEIYADEVLFIDPAHRIEGLAALTVTFPPLAPCPVRFRDNESAAVRQRSLARLGHDLLPPQDCRWSGRQGRGPPG